METKSPKPEEALRSAELAAGVPVERQFVKDLLSEMASQATKEYLTVEELAKRLSMGDAEQCCDPVDRDTVTV